MEKGPHQEQFFAISRQDWSLDRRGERDEARHNDKVKESIKDNLDDIVSDGDIITADPHSKKTIKVPMRSLELPRFKFGEPKEGVGSGEGGEQPGDAVGGEPGEGEGQAGDQPGQEYYEAEMTIEEIQEMVFEDLGLPRIKPKETGNVTTENYVFEDVRKKRSMNNLDLGRTIMENMQRNARETGKAEIGNISPDDYRVRMWEQEKKPENNAVVVAMADISGSMGEFEKYITRAFCWWTTSFLKTKYPEVDIVFIAHDTEAYEVNEQEFFTRGMGGGTKCSSANRMALDIMNDRYPPDRYNVYPLHFSDGDNWGNDNKDCIDLVQQLLDADINQYAYVQIGKQGWSDLLKDYNSQIDDERFKGLTINEKSEVLEALKQVFNAEEEEEA